MSERIVDSVADRQIPSARLRDRRAGQLSPTSIAVSSALPPDRSDQAQFALVKRIGTAIAERVLALAVPLLCPRRRSTSPESVGSILVVEPYGLGDLVLASGLIGSLHRLHPDAAIGVVCDERWSELVRELPGVSHVYTNSYPWATGHWTRRNIMRVVDVAGALRARRYDVGIDIRGDIRSQALLVAAGCRERIGFTDYMGSTIDLRGRLLTAHTSCGIAPRLDELHRLVQMVPGGRSAPPLRIEIPHARRVGGGHRPLAIGIHAGAGHEFKKWPVAHWRALTAALAIQPPAKTILLGSPGEVPELHAIADGLLPPTAVRACCTVRELIDTISELDLLLCLDSAPFHIAAGTKTPAVALFGPGQPRRWSHAGAAEIIVRPDGYDPAASRGAKQLTRADYSVAGISPAKVAHAVERLILQEFGVHLAVADALGTTAGTSEGATTFDAI